MKESGAPGCFAPRTRRAEINVDLDCIHRIYPVGVGPRRISPQGPRRQRQGGPRLVGRVAVFGDVVVEKSLSMDNIFVIAMLFGFFAVPPLYQPRVLFWGILGALLLRGAMIGAGARLIAEFHWILYLFAVFLILTAFRMLLLKPTDLIFAVDSIPAIFAITGDPFLVFTSNVFAILGLQSLYFALARMVKKFRNLKFSLALILMVVSVKMLLAEWLKLALGKNFNLYLLTVIIAILAPGMAASLRAERPRGPT